jgi:hypothetical protein
MSKRVWKPDPKYLNVPCTCNIKSAVPGPTHSVTCPWYATHRLVLVSFSLLNTTDQYGRRTPKPRNYQHPLKLYSVPIKELA